MPTPRCVWAPSLYLCGCCSPEQLHKGFQLGFDLFNGDLVDILRSTQILDIHLVNPADPEHRRLVGFAGIQLADEAVILLIEINGYGGSSVL